MEFRTTRFGVLQVDENELLTFPRGLPGFEDHRRFVWVQTGEANALRYLQSLDDPDLTFILADPLAFRPDYKAVVWPEDALDLKLDDVADASIYCILRVPADPSQASANLQAPIVINRKDRLGKQVVQADGAYNVRHLLRDELKRAKRLVGGGAEGGPVKRVDAG